MIDIRSNVKLSTGSEMPNMALGTWELHGNVTDIIKTALNMGYRMIDTSGDYGSQPGIGQAILDSEMPRESLYIVTKVEEVGDAYKTVLKNLRELQMDYVDLMLIHRPPPNDVGENIWRDLIRARQEEKIRDIGVSNYSEQQIQILTETTDMKPVVNQIEWSPFGWSAEMLAFCKTNDIVIQAYSPLTRSERLDDGLLQDIGDKYGKTPAQVLIRWALQNGIVPLPKASTEKHLSENIDVFDFALSHADMTALDTINENYSALSDVPIYQKNREVSI